jgi:hypothetical protein
MVAQWEGGRGGTRTHASHCQASMCSGLQVKKGQIFSFFLMILRFELRASPNLFLLRTYRISGESLIKRDGTKVLMTLYILSNLIIN